MPVAHETGYVPLMPDEFQRRGTERRNRSRRRLERRRKVWLVAQAVLLVLLFWFVITAVVWGLS